MAVTLVLSPKLALSSLHKQFNILELKMTISLSGVFVPYSELFSLFYVLFHVFCPGLQKLVFLETKHLSQELTIKPFKDLLFSRLFLSIYR